MNLHTRIITALCVIFTLVLGGCGGGDTHEKIVDEMIVQLDRVGTAASKITDKASAETAIAEMKSAAAEIKKIGERAKKLGDPSAEVQKKLEEKMKVKGQEIQTKMMSGIASAQKAGPEAMAIFGQGMQEFATTMQDAGKALGAK
jgi:hypothetical protein